MRNKKTEKERMDLITLHLPKPWIELMKKMKKQGLISSSSEFIRYAIWNEFKSLGLTLKHADFDQIHSILKNFQG